ncbi:MAG TPA: class I SAM-dependent methyltransferase [Candidatus Marinimicrobia bacterium]|nr:class I SAM-dependent methyltransferase [Candidatus Neomarinimicrobiota bacterium]HRS51471.1 class I SAM-dependent methyltransferase [Candidatus Neomarinimicrobiota bacterium]HRU92741.1 class I SAM-dependent methyltransferase [Candidatus Neomarinimicrobiota bacterium]
MIKYFRDLLNDRIRIENFRQAINNSINHNSTVVEIGSALGTYSFFAAQAGAKTVYAIEMNDIFYIGRELAECNNLADRINFIHGRSTEIDLPEKADLIIMEDFGPFFYYHNLLEVLRDARERFLKTDGRFIPARIILYITPFECQAWRNELDLFAADNDQLFGFDWSYTTEIAFNQTYYADSHPKKLLSAPFPVKTIDLKTETDFTFQKQFEVSIQEDGQIHGLIGWWDCWFTNKQFFSNSPQSGNNSWGQLIFPFRYPINVKTGDQVKISLMVLESAPSGLIDYKWKITHPSGSQEQDTFSGRFFDLQQFSQMRRDVIPSLNEKGLIQAFILNQIDGKNSWDEIAESVMKTFPGKFASKEDVFKIIVPLSGFLKGTEI